MYANFDAIGRIDAFDLLRAPRFVPRSHRNSLRSAMDYFENVIDAIIEV